MQVIYKKVGMLQTNCSIVYDEDSLQAAVIDPGDKADAILEDIKKHGLKVKYIFLTHGHYDHIMAVNKVKDETGAQVVIHEADSRHLKDPKMASNGLTVSRAKCQADITVKGGEVFDVGNMKFEYIHTPGHTKGSCVLRCGDTLFAGDTLFKNDCGRCDLPDGNYKSMLSSLKILHDLEGDYKVIPGHDDFTTLEQERQNNPYMREAMGK